MHPLFIVSIRSSKGFSWIDRQELTHCRKWRHCDYTAPDLLPPRVGIGQWTEYVERGPCGWELSSQGQTALLHAASAVAGDIPGSQLRFTQLVKEILGLFNLTARSLIREYGYAIHPWLPLFDPKTKATTYIDVRGSESPCDMVLLLAIYLATRRPCGRVDHLSRNTLYITMKQLLATLQIHPKMKVHNCLLQTTMLVALYECGHGLSQAAYSTLSSVVAAESLHDHILKLRGCISQEESSLHLRASILILDR